MEKVCKKCSTKVPQRAKFCRNCRSQEFIEPITCSHCNATIPRSDINFCPTCGRRLGDSEQSRQWMIAAPDAEPQFCEICRQSIENDLIFCPNCTNAFHFNHLSSWIIEHNNCPVCKTRLLMSSGKK